MRKIIITIDDDGRFVDISTEEVEKETEAVVGIEKKILELHSMFAKVFDSECAAWTKDQEFNLAFLKQQEDYFNNVLRIRGYVFLNEVYAALGIPRTKLGQIYGWVYDENKPRISFGLDKFQIRKGQEIVNGYSDGIILNFNVHGDILNMI